MIRTGSKVDGRAVAEERAGGTTQSTVEDTGEETRLVRTDISGLGADLAVAAVELHAGTALGTGAVGNGGGRDGSDESEDGELHIE